MFEPYFSVCIPNFNYANYIGETIESVLFQNFTDFEIIIVDNASTDNSWEIIQQYARQDNRIKIFQNKVNIGFAPNLQKATEHANGQFVLLLSSDDLMKQGALKKFKEVYTTLGTDAHKSILHTASSIIDSKGKEQYVCSRFRKEKSNFEKDYFLTIKSIDRFDAQNFDGSFVVSTGKDVLQQAILTAKSPATFCATMYPRKLWEQVGGYDTAFQIIPDTIYLYKLLNLPHSQIVYIRELLFDYRNHESNQLSTVKGDGPLKTQLDAYLFLVRYNDNWFKDCGIEKKYAVHSFLTNYCANESLISLSFGNLKQAYKKLTFGKACYPNAIFSNRKFIIGYALLLGFPISVPLLNFFRKRRNKI